LGAEDVKPGYEVAFSADDNRIAVLSHSLVTIRNIMHPENRLPFDPWPKGMADGTRGKRERGGETA